LDELRIKKISPIFSNPAGRRRHPSPFRTTMAGNREEQQQCTPAALEKKLLTEEGFSEIMFVATPPPRWLNGRHRRRASGAAA
jgi:hypothetical protein